MVKLPHRIWWALSSKDGATVQAQCRSGCRESHHHQGHEKQKVGMEVLSPTVWKWSISIQSYSKKCRSCPLKQIGARNSIILSNCLPKSEICQECNVYVPFCNLILWQFSMITFLIRVHPTHIAIIHLALQRDQLPFPWELQGLSTLVLMFFFAQVPATATPERLRLKSVHRTDARLNLEDSTRKTGLQRTLPHCAQLS